MPTPTAVVLNKVSLTIFNKFPESFFHKNNPYKVKTKLNNMLFINMLMCSSSLIASENGETKIQENGELWERGGNGIGQRSTRGIPIISLIYFLN